MEKEIAGRKEIVKQTQYINKHLRFYLHSDFRDHLGMVHFLMFSPIHAPSQSAFFTLCQEQGRHFIWVSMYLSAALNSDHTLLGKKSAGLSMRFEVASRFE